eukprot:2458014-Rhodomonas_salina.1
MPVCGSNVLTHRNNTPTHSSKSCVHSSNAPIYSTSAPVYGSTASINGAGQGARGCEGWDWGRTSWATRGPPASPRYAPMLVLRAVRYLLWYAPLASLRAVRYECLLRCLYALS